MKNNKGFTLAELVVAAGILGVLSLAGMQLMKNMGDASKFAQSVSDEVDLKNSIRLLLDDERYCRVSLAGNGSAGAPTSAVTFKKSDHDEDTEGLDIALFLSNQDGDTRTLKKFNGANNPGSEDKSKFGKLTIKSIKLIMNNGVGTDYADSSAHNDVGVVRVVYTKKVSSTKERELTMNFDINVGLSTGQSPESSGVSRILSCSSVKESSSNEELACHMAGKFYDESSSPKCRISKVGITKLASRGNYGGGQSSVKCPAGMGVTGMRGKSGSEVDAFGIICREINYETLEPIASGSAYSSHLAGGNGGTSFSITCPAGKFAVGLVGRSASRIDRIGLICAKYDGSSTSNSTQRGGSGGSSFSLKCPANSILREVEFNSGSQIDRIQGVCF